jgi:restriction system protein
MSTEGTKQAGFKYLLTYQYSLVLYDLTSEFCPLFLPGRELLRQRDQMTQAGRSGKQNIVEGYELNSLEGYIKFLGIAKGSIKELEEDCEDYLRQRGLEIWDKDDPRMSEIREMRVVREPFPHIPQYPHIPHDPELAANLLIMLCQRSNYLLEKQIESLRAKFIKEGGFRENLFKERMAEKNKVVPKSEFCYTPAMNSIAVDDFTKLDFRVGTIISAEKPEWSEKLLRLKVDFGSSAEELGVKQVLSGIAKCYTPEDLVGMQAIFLVNLPVRIIHEEKSEAMILTAQRGDSYCIIQPQKESTNGSRIC